MMRNEGIRGSSTGRGNEYENRDERRREKGLKGARARETIRLRRNSMRTKDRIVR